MTSKKIAWSGICCGLVTACLLAVVYLPTLTAAFEVVASVLVVLPVLKFKSKLSSFLVFASSATLAMLITGNFVKLATFVLYFGLYGVFKLSCDNSKFPKAIKWLFKFLYFAIAGVFCFGLFKLFGFDAALTEMLAIINWIGLLLSVLFVVLFDLVYAQALIVMEQFLKKFLK